MTTTHSPVVHKSVLLEESIHHLEILRGDVVVDGTFGGGGHSRVILDRYRENIFLICVDLDEDATQRFESLFANNPNAVFVHANFKEAQTILNTAGKRTANKVLLDLGTSTFQLLSDTRGFSFQSDAPLRMTFSQAGSHTGFTAEDIVNNWEEASIADIIFYYGEERKARVIAKAIVAARSTKPILTARDLAMLIEEKIPRRGKIHPATKTFQALRIAVNDEIQVLESALSNWWNVLAHGGRIAVITFHSIEDRAVKRWMLAVDKEQKRVITKKPTTPSQDELIANPRARSAKLRIIEKL